MSRESQNTRFHVALSICLVLGLIEAAILMAIGDHLDATGLELVFRLFLLVCFGVMVGFLQWFLPYATIVLGITKIREQRREDLEALGDENVVHADPEGERKLHDYLTATTSLEARIGLLQRSDPYIPPEQRAPEGKKPPRAFLSKTGWNILSGTMIAGTLSGVLLGHLHGLGGGPSDGTGVLRLFAAAMAGALLSAPFGLVAALLFGRITQVEEEDDAGAGGSETA